MSEKTKSSVTEEEKVILEDGIEYEEVTTDDRVIGRAFRVSGAISLGLVLVGGGIFWWLNRPKAVQPAQVVQTEAPKTVVQDIQPPAVRFVDVTAASGIDFVHQNGAEGEKLLPETMGGGSAFFDRDGDGDFDLLFVNGCFWPHSKRAGERPTQALYANDSKGRFTNVTKESGLDATFYGIGAACADVDADGDADVFFTAVGTDHFFA